MKKDTDRKKYKFGYTQGTFDMFHIGHLNLLCNAKDQCDFLIVGVNSDELVKSYKHKATVINEKERSEIVKNIKAVDKCIIVDTLDKVEILKKVHFDVIFIGDDWKGNARWKQTEKDLQPYGVDVVYLKYTEGISSTLLRGHETEKINED